MENLIKQFCMRIFHVEEENKAQTSRVVKNRKVSSRRTRSFKDSRRGQSWGRKLSSEISLDHDKTEGDEFRTAVAAAAFVVSSIENKHDEIKQEPISKSRKTLSEILEESPRPEISEDVPGGAINVPMPSPVITTTLEENVSTTPPFDRTPADNKPDEETSQKEPVTRLGQADIWEKTEIEKITKRFVNLKAKILEWEKRKKSKAKNKLARREGKIEWKRVQALQAYTRKMEIIEKISKGARSRNEENMKKEETRVKGKANMIRSTRKIPKPTYICC
uniref:remorin-like n=1 Tax=Erigeron canadensis TaxID=72917 RepID=UPI001CB9238F|nr:remorin-like [Erigeron canadensis]